MVITYLEWDIPICLLMFFSVGPLKEPLGILQRFNLLNRAKGVGFRVLG